MGSSLMNMAACCCSFFSQASGWTRPELSVWQTGRPSDYRPARRALKREPDEIGRKWRASERPDRETVCGQLRITGGWRGVFSVCLVKPVTCFLSRGLWPKEWPPFGPLSLCAAFREAASRPAGGDCVARGQRAARAAS